MREYDDSHWKKHDEYDEELKRDNFRSKMIAVTCFILFLGYVVIGAIEKWLG